MNLVKQFPDVSVQIREKRKLGYNRNRYAIATANAQKFDQIKTIDNLYDGAFMKWHYTLLFIIMSLFASIYFIILNSSSLFSWVIS